MQDLGSLTSCPGLKTAAAATVRNPWYGKPFHRFHLLLYFNVLPGFKLKHSSTFR
jgi:hypothetical protein